MSDLELLQARVGRYGGHGIDHEDRPFHGEFELEPLFDRAFTFAFRATGIDGTSLHQERSWIATDSEGRLCLWTLNTNTTGCGCHPRRHGAPVGGAIATLVFGQGEVNEIRRYRVEIAIDLWPNGDLGYRYSWGMPGEAFRPRSSVRMSRNLESPD